MENNFKYINGGFPPLKYCENKIEKNTKKERLFVPNISPLYFKDKDKNKKIFHFEDDEEEQLNNILSIN